MSRRPGSRLWIAVSPVLATCHKKPPAYFGRYRLSSGSPRSALRSLRMVLAEVYGEWDQGIWRVG